MTPRLPRGRLTPPQLFERVLNVAHSDFFPIVQRHRANRIIARARHVGVAQTIDRCRQRS